VLDRHVGPPARPTDRCDLGGLLPVDTTSIRFDHGSRPAAAPLIWDHTHTLHDALDRLLVRSIIVGLAALFVARATSAVVFFLFYRNGSQRARSFMLIFVTSDDWRCMCSAVTTIRLLRLTTQSTCFSYFSQPLHSHRLYYVLRVNSLFC